MPSVRSPQALIFGLALAASHAVAAKEVMADRDAIAVPPIGETLQVGALTLRRCEGTRNAALRSRAITAVPSIQTGERGWCGRLSRPLDPTGHVPGTISIYFELYPHTAAVAQSSVGMLVATEGGPGYPATGSRDEYLELFQPLRAQRDVLLMDNRGTGRSAAIDCYALQTDPTLTESNIGQCGRHLGARAVLYSTTQATDDLAAILDALGSQPIDLYGDSYGTFFAQVFAVRHSGKLRSIILDGAYPLDGPDYAWYPSYAPAMRAKFNQACERSEPCNRLPGASMDHIVPALEALRRDADAARVGQLATVLFASAPAYATVRETDAAARAYVNADRAPLLRLLAEAQLNVDSRDATRSPALFSAGLAAAVTCEDAPQIFDMRLEPSQRDLAREQVLTDRRHSAPNTYAPFTIDEYRRMPLDYAFIDECVSWPRVPAAHLAAMARLRGSAYPDVPALIISGDLDDLTPVADGASVARRFAHGKQIVVPNGFHVNALGHSRSECPAQLARRFIETLEVSDTKCLQSVPEVRVLGAFAQHVRELEPAAAEVGNEALSAEMQIVTGTVLTIGDAIARIGSHPSGKAAGLRGGAFDISPGPGPATSLTLHEVRWAKDLSVSGVVLSPMRAGTGTADVVATGPGGMKGSLHVRWTEGVPKARAMVRGAFGSRAVVAKTPAP